MNQKNNTQHIQAIQNGGILEVMPEYERLEQGINGQNSVVKKLICSVCGYEITPDIDKHYISIEAGQTGIATAFKKDEAELFDTFDCERCGCQHIAQPRNRVYIALHTEDFMRITNEDQEETIED